MTFRGYPLPQELARDPRLVTRHRQAKLREIAQTIKLAEIRCISVDELLSRIEHLWDDPEASELVYRACEESFSANQLVALAESVKRLASAADQLRSAQKSKVYRSVKRILSHQPADIAAPIAAPWLDHQTKFRREIAQEIIRRSGVTATLAPSLLAAYQRTGDQESLKLIARNPEAVAAVDASAVIRLIHDDYWKMRVIESLLIADTERATLLHTVFPHEFIWAAGRQKDTSLLPLIRRLFDANPDDLALVHTYAWALGQMGAKSELARLRELIPTPERDE